MGRGRTGLDWGQSFDNHIRQFLGEDGKIFVVDTGGGGDMLGSQEAIDACVSGRGDVVIRKAGGEEVTETVAFNKTMSYIAEGYGAAPQAKGELFSIYSAAAFIDGPAATITGRVYIEGIGFVSRDAGTTFYSGAAALIGGLATAAPFGTWLKHCRFPKWGLTNRIGLGIEGGSDITIEECAFEGVGANFDSGIYAQGGLANLNLIRNIGRDCDALIEFGSFAGGGPDCLIQENVAVHGTLLEVSSAAVGAIVNNWIPTKDVGNAYGAGVSLATLEGYGLWFADNHYSETP